MARNAVIDLQGNVWTLVSAPGEDITAATFQNRGGVQVELLAANGETPPADDAPGATFLATHGATAVALADLFPSVSGANRLYARSSGAEVWINHA